ncbi:MAG: oligosaccharide flippase family protein [Thiogranum sp.]|nr:oligosaccharide flippase family protein [Thiogranum sp.]
MAGSIPRNATVAVIQVVVVGVVLFFLYRFLLTEIGAARLGIWSVVMATVSTSKFAQLGFSGSTIKYVAKHLALDDTKTVSRSIQTALVSTAVAVAVICILAYPLLRWMLTLFMPDEGIEDALNLLPILLISLWLSSMAGIFQASLDGCQRIDARGYLMISSYIFYYGVAVWFVGDFGLEGLAYAQIIHNGFLFLAGWYVLKRIMRYLPVVPFRWYAQQFREMFQYGVKFQFVSLIQMLYEPVTKLLLTNFGGLALAGYYEMANRMILQLRSLFVAGNQVLVPVIAEAHERDGEDARRIYRKSYAITLLLSAPFFCVTIAMVPAISIAWIGRYEPAFVGSAIILSVAWWINTMSAPAYFSYLGQGKLQWPMIGYAVIALINVVFGYTLGLFLDGTGPIAGWSIALVVGGVVVTIAFAKEHSVPFMELIPRESIAMLLASVFIAGASLAIYYETRSGLLEAAFVLCASLALAFVFVRFHPFGKNVSRFIRHKLKIASTT